MEKITSVQNSKIKYLLELQAKSKERRQSGLFVVEGVREIEHCISCGYEPHAVFFCPEILGTGAPYPMGDSAPSSLRPLPSELGPLPLPLSGGGQAPIGYGAPAYQVSPEVYDKVAYRGGTEGVIAEMKAKSHTLKDLKLRENPLVVVLESVEKPGNLGAMLRSADAAGVDAVIVCDPLTDLYNPNLIRASIGGIFSVQTAACNSEEAIAFLKGKGIQILTAQLQDSNLYYDQDMKRGTAIVMGTEATGLTDIWREAADAHIRIPMLGILDSLNVSVSAAILMYEAVRQRQHFCTL